jgi:hypothetical protein
MSVEKVKPSSEGGASPHTCRICLEDYDESRRCPRLLPWCGHTFCSNCLHSLFAQLKPQQVFSCPLDRKEPSASVAGDYASAEQLPKNFFALDIIEKERLHLLAASPSSSSSSSPSSSSSSSSPSSCELCEEKHPAVACCLDCSQNICATAKSMHMRATATKTHRIVALEELQINPSLAATAPLLCQEHKQPVRFYDKQCALQVCVDCVVLDHHGHKCEAMAVAATSTRQDLAQIITSSSKKAEELRAAEEAVAGVQDALTVALGKGQEGIGAAFALLHQVFIFRHSQCFHDMTRY